MWRNFQSNKDGPNNKERNNHENNYMDDLGFSGVINSNAIKKVLDVNSEVVSTKQKLKMLPTNRTAISCMQRSILRFTNRTTRNSDRRD